VSWMCYISANLGKLVSKAHTVQSVWAFCLGSCMTTKPVTADTRRWRDGESSAQRGYGYKWQQARLVFLREHPLCKMHMDLGRVVPATVVDHIQPHKGDLKLFWDRKNWQPLCKSCHDGAKQMLESRGRVIGCGLNGMPVDPNHHWSLAAGRKG